MAVREVLTFRLGTESYAVNILKVQEIRGVDRITEIANTPDFIRGVIDLRGIIAPIVDMSPGDFYERWGATVPLGGGRRERENVA